MILCVRIMRQLSLDIDHIGDILEYADNPGISGSAGIALTR